MSDFSFIPITSSLQSQIRLLSKNCTYLHCCTICRRVQNCLCGNAGAGLGKVRQFTGWVSGSFINCACIAVYRTDDTAVYLYFSGDPAMTASSGSNARK